MIVYVAGKISIFLIIRYCTSADLVNQGKTTENISYNSLSPGRESFVGSLELAVECKHYATKSSYLKESMIFVFSCQPLDWNTI
jgi:hypothetical protein